MVKVYDVHGTEVVEGVKVRIIDMDGEAAYCGRTGVVRAIDGIGQVHGSWGGCALVPEVDLFEVVSE